MIKENIYINRDNINKLEFRKNGLPLSLNAITKIDLIIEDLGITISDEVAGDFPIKWLLDPPETGMLEMQIGGTENLESGSYIGKFYIYDLTYTNGIYWTSVKLEVDL